MTDCKYIFINPQLTLDVKMYYQVIQLIRHDSKESYESPKQGRGDGVMVLGLV